MEAVLEQAIEDMKSAAMQAGPMKWGADDCLLCFAGPLQTALGYDVAQKFRGKYRSKIGAHKMLKRMGFGTIADAVADQAKMFMWDKIPINDVTAGDIGVLDILGNQTCAMMHRSGFWIARSEKGFAAVPVQAAIAAYRVPRPPHFGAIPQAA